LSPHPISAFLSPCFPISVFLRFSFSGFSFGISAFCFPNFCFCWLLSAFFFLPPKLLNLAGVLPLRNYTDLMSFKAIAMTFFGVALAFAIPSQAISDTAPGTKPGVSQESTGASNPYAVIVDRNIFHLNAPPPPESADTKKLTDMPKVNYNGILKIGDDVHALFSIAAKDTKKSTFYCKLSPGERNSDSKDNDLELVRISPDHSQVDILINGLAMTLSMATNSAAGPAAPAGKGPAPAAVAAAAPSGSSIVMAGGSRSSPYKSVSIGGGSSSSSGDSSSGGVTVAGGSSAASALGGGGTSGNNPGSTAINAFSGSGQPSGQYGNIPTGPVTPPDQQELIMAAQSIGGNMPPLMPHIQENINGEPK
jgi:uncharacterized membrane protein YgcG